MERLMRSVVPCSEKKVDVLGRIVKNLGLYLILILLVVSVINMFLTPEQARAMEEFYGVTVLRQWWITPEKHSELASRKRQ